MATHTKSAKTEQEKSSSSTPENDKEIERISTIITNARGMWFMLLGAQVFAAVTLAGVEDVVFFDPATDTMLPLLGISVPVISFFWAGALLVAAVYIYFLLYLEQMWQILGEAGARYNGKPLAESIHPWVVSDTALRMRDLMRQKSSERANPRAAPSNPIIETLKAYAASFINWLTDKPRPEDPQASSRPRGMTWIANVATILLVWVFGLVIVLWFWWRSMPAHDPILTAWLAFVLVSALWVCWGSVCTAISCLAGTQRRVWGRPMFALFCGVIGGLTSVRTYWDPWEGEPRRMGDFFTEILRPDQADLRGVALIDRPKDWQGKEAILGQFRLQWCKERMKRDCGRSLEPGFSGFEDAPEEARFQNAWNAYWTMRLGQLQKRDYTRVDWRGALLHNAILDGLELSFADFRGADLTAAELDQAKLGGADFRRANLSYAKLPGAYLNFSQMEGATMIRADVRSAMLYSGNFFKAMLFGARMENADLTSAIFTEANLTVADLRRASIDNVSFINTKLNNADLSYARLTNVKFLGANLKLTKFHEALISGTVVRKSDFNKAGAFFQTDVTNAAFRNADLSGLDGSLFVGLNSAFGDGSVIIDEAIRPTSWCKQTLGDEEFYGRWRGIADPEADPRKEAHFNNQDPIPPHPC